LIDKAGITGLAVTSDDKGLFIAFDDGLIRYLDLNTGSLIHDFNYNHIGN